MEFKNNSENNNFNQIALECRRIIFRLLSNGKPGHIGGSLSCLDLLVVIYYRIVVQKEDFHFIMSKGHCECGLYSVLLYFNLLDEKIDNYKLLNSKMQGHPNKNYIDALEYSSGSLGQGISFAVGKALSLGNKSNSKVIVLAGDGEMQEGQVWEALQSCIRYKINNFILIIDMNKFQLENSTLMITKDENLEKFLNLMGFAVKTIDGHSYKEIYEMLSYNIDSPQIILAKTVKGKGISFMENNNDYHGRELTEDELNNCFEELKCQGE